MRLEVSDLNQRTDEALQSLTQHFLGELQGGQSLIWLSLGALDSLPATRAVLCEHPQALPFELIDPDVALMSARVMLIAQAGPLVVLDADPSELDVSLGGEEGRSAPLLARLCAQAGVSLLVIGRGERGTKGKVSPLRRFAWSVSCLDDAGRCVTRYTHWSL